MLCTCSGQQGGPWPNWLQAQKCDQGIESFYLLLVHLSSGNHMEQAATMLAQVQTLLRPGVTDSFASQQIFML